MGDGRWAMAHGWIRRMGKAGERQKAKAKTQNTIHQMRLKRKSLIVQETCFFKKQ